MTTTIRAESALPETGPVRDLNPNAAGVDRAFASIARVIAATVLVITGGIGLFLAFSMVPTWQTYGLGFFTESRWEPEANVLGIAAVLLGTITIAGIAISVAFPLALLTALYIAEYAPPGARSFLTSVIDLMAAVPSIIYGLWGFFLLQPHTLDLARFVHQHLGFIPIFDAKTNPDAANWDRATYTGSAFMAGLTVAMMVMPMACAVMRQVFAQTPPGEREAALALGSTHWGMVRTVVIPFGMGGIIGGTMLGLGRALGETIAVLLILSPSFEFKFRPLEIGSNNISALIAGRFPEATGNQLSALLAAGFVLFVLTLAINTLAAMVVARSRSGLGADA